MKKHISIFAFATACVLAGGVVVACSDDSDSSTNGTSSGNPLNPGDSSMPGTDAGGDANTGGDAACSTPVGCFCGTPSTQVQFLNRCTSAVALPVTLTVKPATTANIP